MLKEFVHAISGLAVQASEPKLLRDPADPRKAYVVHNGELKETSVQPPLLASVVETTEDLMSAIGIFGSDTAASIWHDRTHIVALLDNADRLEMVRLPLSYSQQFKAIQALPKAFEQRALVLFLKRTMAGAIDDGLIAIFRQLDFSQREDRGGTVKHGDESLGRAVHAAVANATAIPEFMTVTLMVYSNPDLKYPVTIRLSVDVDVQRCSIELTPLPDEVENAILATQAFINEQLRNLADEGVTVFNGTPMFRVEG